MTRTQIPPFVLWLEWEGYYADGDVRGPVAVVRNRRMIDANSAARARGLRPGMGLAELRSLVRECEVREWQPDPARASEWLERCVPYSGRIEPIEEHIAAIDLSGHPRPEAIARRLVNSLGGYGRLHYGAGPSKWVAKLAAILDAPWEGARDPGGFLASLDVERLLPVAPESRSRLEFLGYGKIGDVAALPLDVLRGQFGTAALTIRQAARGTLGDPVAALYPPDSLREAFPFVDPIQDTKTLEATWDLLAGQLAERVVGQEAQEVAIAVEWEDGEVERASRRFSRPVHDRATIRTAIRAQSEFRRECGVVGLSASLARVGPIRLRQNALFVAAERPGADAAVRSLQEAFGENAVILAGQIELPRRERVLREWRSATGWR